MGKPKLLFAALLATLSALVLPPFFVERAAPSGTAFEYVPPPGFVRATGEAARKLSMPAQLGDSKSSIPQDPATPEALRSRAWVRPPPVGVPIGMVPRIVALHSDQPFSMTQRALDIVSRNMVEHQAKNGLIWTPVEKRIVRRADGRRVGLLAYDTASDPNANQAAAVPGRTIQLAFPDDEGLTIVTASFTAVDAAQLGPQFEKTLEDARGVAQVAGEVPGWLRAACALLGLAVGLGLGAAWTRWRHSRSAE